MQHRTRHKHTYIKHRCQHKEGMEREREIDRERERERERERACAQERGKARSLAGD